MRKYSITSIGKFYGPKHSKLFATRRLSLLLDAHLWIPTFTFGRYLAKLRSCVRKRAENSGVPILQIKPKFGENGWRYSRAATLGQTVIRLSKSFFFISKHSDRLFPLLAAMMMCNLKMGRRYAKHIGDL